MQQHMHMAMQEAGAAIDTNCVMEANISDGAGLVKHTAFRSQQPRSRTANRCLAIEPRFAAVLDAHAARYVHVDAYAVVRPA